MGNSQPSSRDLVAGFAAMVASARESAGWSQAELGRQAGVSFNTVNAIEREIRAPSLRVAAALAAALGLKVWLHQLATASDPTAPEAEPAPKTANKKAPPKGGAKKK